jgi:protocatechuate 3,4-dioxygenase beta subunit
LYFHSYIFPNAQHNCFLFFSYSDGKAGIPFRLSIAVIDTNNCTPLVNALVDLWHCDAIGIYSHYIAASQGISGIGNDNETFFRGTSSHMKLFS